MIKMKLAVESLLTEEVVERTFYFHVDEKIGRKYADKLSAYTDNPEKTPEALIEVFEDLVRMSLGRPSEDGTIFQRDEAYTQNFLDSLFYTELLTRVFESQESAVEFMIGMLPRKFATSVRAKLASVDLETVGSEELSGLVDDAIKEAR